MRFAAGIMSCLLAACVSSTPAPSPTLSNRAICAKLVDDFFAGWNAHEPDRVAGLFTADLEFHDGVGGKARDLARRDDLQRYLTERFALDDRFSGLTISIPENPAPYAANPTVSFVRTAGGTTYRGNAKLVCAGNALTGVVMSAE
jgi:hypothetical protein